MQPSRKWRCGTTGAEGPKMLENTTPKSKGNETTGFQIVKTHTASDLINQNIERIAWSAWLL